ncbi:non-hydrolyzing UDP-N-acetylglucosamine 2-epimerase [Flavobacterium channae]|uniref:non-hydrolyzing UDP-N-acetylglucosamine 2-epimerase n=1 Tax=Flavobacterium channae TaxID=2897181 RepID=UPI001E518624|nr:UDP-N-acetylglucosamine 2-epimerase (non-hydrolyzing) [Flavobacterium channae]UGS24167.1 UDP-N-acetylglucosamine 2-epimerase (non-hydrolyzing) [Flavobacterium channae]
MKKIMLVFGTRPEAIKMAPLILEFKKNPFKFETKVCVTGQHKEMLEQVLDFFSVVPDYNLNIMKPQQDLYDVTSNVMSGLREVFQKEKPDYVLVHGDTTTCMAASLAAFYQQIKVVHVEAGLRTNNIYSPWPEEINRQITSRIAMYHFAPTELSKNNLLRENIAETIIDITGNTVIDALLIAQDIIKSNLEVENEIQAIVAEMGYDVKRLDSEKKMVLITGHRRENFGQGFMNICNAIKKLSQNYPSIDFVYPMHLNPNVRNAIDSVFPDFTKIANLFFIEPLEYREFVYLMSKSYLILTDSGGVQEEAPSLGKPVLVMRDTTERPEAVIAGTVKLVGSDTNKIFEETSRLIENKINYVEACKAINPYGDGKACERIVANEIFVK